MNAQVIKGKLPNCDYDKNVVLHIKVNPGKNIDPISPICICQLRWFEEICVTADVPIMEEREDIEGEQFCAMELQWNCGIIFKF